MTEIAAFPFEIKGLDAQEGVVEGLGAAFGNVDCYGDVIAHGAFRRTIAERNGAPLPMLIHHKIDRPIGAWTEMRETSDGLEMRGRIALDTRDGAEARSLLELGALRGLSIGFRDAKRMPGTNGTRSLVDLTLIETSLVTAPANPRARVTGFKRQPGPLTPRDIEQALDDADLGLSNRERKAIASAAIRTLAERSPETDHLARFAAEIEAARATLAPYLKGN